MTYYCLFCWVHPVSMIGRSRWGELLVVQVTFLEVDSCEDLQVSMFLCGNVRRPPDEICLDMLICFYWEKCGK